MKKNRNTFFSEANMYTQGYDPNMGLMAANQPYQSTQSYNSYYSGPNPNFNNQYMPNMNDLENRLAKIERQINRLDHRISKLESNNNIIDDFDSNTTNMYML